MNIGERIVELRLKKNWSQRELAMRAKIDTAVMNRIEKGDRPLRDQEIVILANLLDVNTDYLLGNTSSVNYTNDEEHFLNDINLSLEELKEKYKLTVDGKPATEEEIRGAIAWIKANRLINGEQKK